jgi:membrane-bound metal-dependent hydrolase YbcI (DUF457 family)
MDIISHVLIGKIISFNKNRLAQIWTMIFSYLPDLTQIPFYIMLGYENARPFLFPYNSDWVDASKNHVILNIMWEASHSLFFALLIVLPIILFFKLPKIAFLGYILHIIIDIPTHKGEWLIKPFYPLNYSINGFTNSWAWPIWIMALSWMVLILIIFSLNIFKKKNDRPLNKS